MKPLSFLLILLLLVAFAAAQEVQTSDESAALREEIQRLKEEFAEQRKVDAERIEKLEKRLEEFAGRLEASEGTEGEAASAEDELARLRADAQALAAEVREEDQERGETVFRSRGLGLQALNPEISVTGDLIYTYSGGSGADNSSDFTFRGLGIHIESYLDPYSRFKAAVPVNENGAELGEAYLTRYGAVGTGNMTLGKFRQQFGVVNRWHKHALDYVDFPMPLRQIFGEGGLNQTGVALDFSGPLGGAYQEFEVQVTDGDNNRVFGENEDNRPSILAHYKINRDLSPSTYVEVGATGMVGWNDTWALAGGLTDEETRDAQVYGLDFSVVWEPTERMRYRNLESRTEFYYLRKGLLAPDGSGSDTVQPWGAYTSLQTRLTRTLELGTRFDYYRPEVKDYAGLPSLSLAPLAVTRSGAYQTLTALYLTWWQSPFVKFRVEYDYQDGKGIDPLHQLFLQCVFAAGPHKHERY